MLDFWTSKMPSADRLSQLREHAPISMAPNAKPFAFEGTPPFGQLTDLGVEQCVSLGQTLSFKLRFVNVPPTRPQRGP